MGLYDYINYALKSLLKNPMFEVLQDIKNAKILRQSSFIKRDVGYLPFQIILIEMQWAATHLVYFLQ